MCEFYNHLKKKEIIKNKNEKEICCLNKKLKCQFSSIFVNRLLVFPSYKICLS